MNTEFSEILDRINRREEAFLLRKIDHTAYDRRFIPKDRLILLGGGHISESLTRMAVMLDFSVTVVDDREEFANFERFPEAESVICKNFEAAIEELKITARDYVCVLTRGHSYDRECVTKLLTGEMPFYLGMIGSRRKTAGIFESLREDGVPKEEIEAVHAPIGLSIGALTVSEIAVSICAEMILYRRKNENRATDCLSQTDADMKLLEYLSYGNEPRALVMILCAKGSTPAKSGAMMAVGRNGDIIGTVGGGCGEAQAKAEAQKLIGTGERKVFDIYMDNDAAADEGLVCGGSVRILIEDIVEE